jgi:hypothetical protein
MQEETQPRIGRFIDPLSDMGFKLIFSDNKEMLISFLNALFQGKKQIIGLTYNNTEKRGPQKRYREIRYDLTCTDQDGVQYRQNKIYTGKLKRSSALIEKTAKERLDPYLLFSAGFMVAKNKESYRGT